MGKLGKVVVGVPCGVQLRSFPFFGSPHYTGLVLFACLTFVALCGMNGYTWTNPLGKAIQQRWR
ncbi:mCG146971 [Mus musculus]|nr:mCG146971 [Mus musculus]